MRDDHKGWPTFWLFPVLLTFVIVAAATSCSEAPSAQANPADLSVSRIDNYVTTWRDPVTGCEYPKLYAHDLEPRWEYNNSYESGYHRHRGCYQ